MSSSLVGGGAKSAGGSLPPDDRPPPPDAMAGRPAAAPAPSPRPSPRNTTRSAWISVAYLFCPLSLSSQERVRNRPSTYTLRPLVRYCEQCSAVLPHTCTRC